MFLVGDCTDFIPDTSDVIECETEGANRACNLTCNVANQDLAILEPFVLVCGPAGVLEYMNPYLSRRIPQCSRKRCLQGCKLLTIWRLQVFDCLFQHRTVLTSVWILSWLSLTLSQAEIWLPPLWLAHLRTKLGKNTPAISTTHVHVATSHPYSNQLIDIRKHTTSLSAPVFINS